MRLFFVALLVLSGSLGAQSRLAVSAAPTLIIGNDEADEATTLGKAVSATRRPDGSIIVGDVGKVSLLMFSSQGKLLKSAGRNGSGPGEIGYLHSFMRCGDAIYAQDITNTRRLEFTLDLIYKRAVRVVTPQPYQTRCNGAGKFINYGWENIRAAKPGAARMNVAFWFSGFDELPPKPFGEYPGSERWVTEFGSRPLPFGKQPTIAIGADRAYIGTAETYEIKVVDFTGKVLNVIRDNTALVPVTNVDIQTAIDLEIGGGDAEKRKQAAASYALMKLPATMPAYKSILVDALGQLWVQDYPQAKAKTVRWSVFSPDGKSIGRVQLPMALDVYEIGADYVLGRFVDPEIAIPQIHLYKVTR